MEIAGRAEGPIFGNSLGDVAHIHVDHRDTLINRCQADGADFDHVVHPNLEHLLGDLGLFFGRRHLGFVHQLDEFLDVIGWFNPFLTTAAIPIVPARTVGDVAVDTAPHIVLGGTSEGEAGGILVPDFRHQVVRFAQRKVQRAFANLHVRLDADLLPILCDQLGRVGTKAQRLDTREFDDQTLAVGQQAESFRILLVQADLVEHLRRERGIVFSVLVGVLIARIVRVTFLGDGLTRFASAQEDRFLDLLAIDRVRHRDAEILVRQHLAHLRVFGVGLVERHIRIRTAQTRPQLDDVLFVLLLPLFENRKVRQRDVAFLLIQFTRDSREVQRLRVGEELDLHLVKVRQLIARLVHTDKVRVALEDEHLIADAILGDPRRHPRPVRRVERAHLVQEQFCPCLELGLGNQLVQRCLVRILGVELLQVLGGEMHWDVAITPVLVREFEQERGVRLLERPLHRHRIHLLDLHDRLVFVQHPRGHRRGQVFVQQHIVVPEHDVIGSERCAIRPLAALAQFDRPRLEIGRGGDAFGIVHFHLAAVRRKAYQGVVDDAVDAVEIRGTGKAAAPYAAVGANFIGGHHEGILGQPLIHGRQLAFLDQRGKHRRFLVLGNGRGCRRWGFGRFGCLGGWGCRRRRWGFGRFRRFGRRNGRGRRRARDDNCHQRNHTD